MDRFTWGVVGGVVVLVLAALGAAAVSRGTDRPPDLTTPSGVTLAYALALERGDGAAAWDLLAGSVQANGRRETFIQRVADPGPGRDTRLRITVEDELITGDEATVALARTMPPSSAGPLGFLFGGSGYASRSTVRLVRENGQWRLSAPPDSYLLQVPRG